MESGVCNYAPSSKREISMSAAGVLCFQTGRYSIEFKKKIILSLDEFEAIRLADNEGLYQEQAAVAMGTSRQTFARILDAAHKKVAMALVESRPIVIEGGNVKFCNRGNCRNKPGCPRLEDQSDS